MEIGIGGRIKQWSDWVVGSALALVSLSITHLFTSLHTDQLNLGVGAVEAGLILGVMYLAHMMLILLAAGEQKEGYIGNLIFGAVWLIATAISLTMTLFVRSDFIGVIGSLLQVGVILSAAALMISSLAAWRSEDRQRMFEF